MSMLEKHQSLTECSAYHDKNLTEAFNSIFIPHEMSTKKKQSCVKQQNLIFIYSDVWRNLLEW